MEGIFFKPWIGKDYEVNAKFSKRILILGESHYKYNKEEEAKDYLTIEVIKQQIQGEERYRFLTNIEISFLNKKPSLNDKEEFWNQVVFSNFIQESIEGGPRIRPNQQMWLKSYPGFYSLINFINPQFILVCGIELWRNLPSYGTNGQNIEGAYYNETRFYPLIKGDNTLAYGILHPSSGGFSGRYWHPFIMKALSLA